MSKIEIREHRKAEYPVDDIFINRWSPRAMSGEAVSKDELMSLFEAAAGRLLRLITRLGGFYTL